MRKTPQQPRSRAMVDTLVQAAALTLAERGLAETTTNHVAARAGVSVGSLYQYFEHKDALVEAVLERMVDDLIAVVDARMAGLLGAGPEAAATGLLAKSLKVSASGAPVSLSTSR